MKIIIQIKKAFKEGLEILKDLIREADFATRFITIITVGVPLMFPLTFGICYLMAVPIPVVSLLDYLWGLSLCTLMWMGMIAIRVLINWAWNI